MRVSEHHRRKASAIKLRYRNKTFNNDRFFLTSCAANTPNIDKMNMKRKHNIIMFNNKMSKDDKEFNKSLILDLKT
jgi:S-ribosylhomocysteine lyase LuxS involved in autoinducer biosynthesis